MNRKEAVEAGNKTYIGKKPCKHCGSLEKYVSTYSCAPCAIKKGLEKLNNEELMSPYRTREKARKRLQEWRKSNPERYKEQGKRNPENNCVRAAKRRAAVREQTPPLTPEEQQRVLTIYQECAMISMETSVPHHVDHIIPISKGGLHHPDNLQILTAEDNWKKGGK